MKNIILTLPMMPTTGEKYGKYIIPNMGDVISKVLDLDYYQCVNILDSFNNREEKLDNYLKLLKNNYINYDYLWFDNKNLDNLLINIDRLVEKGYIKEIDTKICKCDCGIVELEKSKLDSFNPNSRKFIIKDDQIICKYCNSVCKEYTERVLAFVPDNINLDNKNVFPKYLQKGINTFQKTIIESYTTISRMRDTGIKYCYNNSIYNIDIDFLWATYLNTFNAEEKILISGNRLIYQMVLCQIIEKCLNENNKTILLAAPQITNISDIQSNPYFKDNELLRKLFIIFNSKWNTNDSNFNEGILTYLYNLDEDSLKKLYDIVTMKVVNDKDLYSNLEYVLKRQFNMQESIKRLKLERKK